MPCVLLSVSDKTNLIPFAQALNELGWTLMATGSTAQHLRDQKLEVIEVAKYTKMPEILSGRVKTLHPAIHAGLLAREMPEDKEILKEFGWQYIDMVVVNLYPFEQTIAKSTVTLAEAIEQIDVGGVTLLRAAAKNYQRVTVISSPKEYEQIVTELKNGGITSETRQRYAAAAFAITSYYDAAIAKYLQPTAPITLNLYPVQELRYGENPHQTATLYGYLPQQGPLGGKLLQGKPLSYNNLLDLDAAWKTVLGFTRPTICIVKHLSPCGIASADTLTEAFQAALASDPISAFGGIIASNQVFDVAVTNMLGDLFVECVIAPDFTAEARDLLKQRTNCRLLAMYKEQLYPLHEWRSINEGLIQQTIDIGDPQGTEWQVVSRRKPTDDELISLRFAWQACQSVKSNAIVLARGEATVGIGGGQPNRIDCVRMAVTRAATLAKGAVMASDAFFPFSDCVELAAEYGITAIIHPGGSKRDAESIAAADAANMVMVLTGVRHFRH